MTSVHVSGVRMEKELVCARRQKNVISYKYIEVGVSNSEESLSMTDLNPSKVDFYPSNDRVP